MLIDGSVTGRIIPNCAFGAGIVSATAHNGLPGGNSGREPPDPIPNSEVKTSSADGSVGLPHARVGHRQAFNAKPPVVRPGVFYFLRRSPRYFEDRFLRLAGGVPLSYGFMAGRGGDAFFGSSAISSSG